MSKYHLIGVYDDGLTTPIGTVGYDAQRIEHQRSWMLQGDFTTTKFVICTPHTFATGVMICRGTGAQHRITRGALTEKAFAKYLDSIWGPDGDIAKVLAPRHTPPKYYTCGICDHYHLTGFAGDCRDDSERFTADQLEAMHGPDILDTVEGEGL